jgi:bacterioferritin (cytochrome b1)
LEAIIAKEEEHAGDMKKVLETLGEQGKRLGARI